MVRAIVIVALVLRLLLLIVAEESTCLKYVEYLRDVQSSRTEDANVKIPPLAIDGSALHLSVEITVPIVLPVLQRNSFTLQLNQSLADIVATVSGKKGLRYRVDVSSRSGNSTVSDPTLKITNVRFIIPTLKVPKPIANQECGRSDNITDVNLLDGGVVKTSPGQFPWLVAIYFNHLPSHIMNYNMFKCVGTLVTNTHVITAAYCFSDGEELNPASQYRVSAGRYALRGVSGGRYAQRGVKEMGRMSWTLSEYRIHPEYRRGQFDANLAIAILSERIEFTPIIQPICLSSKYSELSKIAGQAGYVLGWGSQMYGKNIALAARVSPRMSRPIILQEDCLERQWGFYIPVAKSVFCTSVRDGSDSCVANIGSGFFLQDSLTGQFHLRGVFTARLGSKGLFSQPCNLDNYIIMLDIAQYLEWVQLQILT